MSSLQKRRGPNVELEALVFLFGIIAVVVLHGMLWLAASWGGGPTEQPGSNPLVLGVRLMIGDYRWPGTAATVLLCLQVAALLFLAAVGWRVFARFRGERERIDRANRHLASSRELHASTTAGVTRTAAKLGVPQGATPGVFIGRAIRGDQELWGSWEDMHVDIWGPRTGKTATRAIPNIVAAPGAVVVTSNKRDVVDATRAIREDKGTVYIFDPQNQAGGKPVFWWNPLTYVGDSIVSAVKLAGRFVSVNRQSHARSDAYFEPAAQDLFANLLLAASIDKRPITQVYVWLTRPTDDTPVRILRDAGHRMPAESVESVIGQPDRQRAGVYGTAIQMASFLVADNINEWVTPGSDPSRPEFDHKAFVRSPSDTLYLLSEETNKIAAPLVMALTTILAEEADKYSRVLPNGRLPTPALFVLDEAANVCPWKALPDKFTHFGSRGVIVMVILQSWAQGVSVWGENGMSKLWGAANIRVYGGGVSDISFLEKLAKSGGNFEPRTTSTSHKFGDHRGISRSSRPEAVLDAADLMSMPRGRAFVQISGSRPTLVRTVPWWETEYADRIRESIATHDPSHALSAGVGMAKSR
ncbi:TraM recognition domain-containing protein (plasmid) [Embleya sp. NBC_00888]|uniref:type IV secretory system conjugative DNA transfer family protein n=1 Tax=Embleya sp. NBC_00888 TaxID=2975960 RepID=UPI002F919616|nr:TraM recognition domain-containing protein [Embleya sp. NBC_00888]